MNANFEHGLRDARHTLGIEWAIAAGAGSVLLLAIAGVLEGQAVATASGARDAQLRLLGGVVFGLVLPLFAFGASARLGGSSSELMGMSWPRHGGNRRVYVFGRQALLVLLTALVAGVTGMLALGIGSAMAAPGVALPLSVGNLLSVAWVGALGSLGYIAALAVAHMYAGRLGRLAFLIGDWLFGSGAGLLALPWPRAHLRSLLGGHAPLGFAPRDSAVCLVVLALTACLLYLRRVPR